MFRGIKTYSGIIESYEAIIRHIRPCIYNLAIFRSSKACRTCKIIMHNQSHGIEQFIQAFTRVFRHIQGYWCIFSHTHRRATRRERKTSPSLFENWKKCRDSTKKDPDCVHHRVKFSILIVVLRVSRIKKFQNVLMQGLFFCCFRRIVYQSAQFHPLPHSLPPARKKFWLGTAVIHYSFCKTPS